MTRAVFVLLVAAGAARADVESGPKAGDKAEGFKVFVAVGANEGKEVDPVADRKGDPTVYLFVNAAKFDRPMARFMKELDGKLGDAGEKAAAVAVWVGGDLDKNKERLPLIQMSVKYEKTALTVSSETAGPPAWAVNPDAHLTVVVVGGGKVVKSFAFVSVNETDAPKVVESLKRATKK